MAFPINPVNGQNHDKYTFNADRWETRDKAVKPPNCVTLYDSTSDANQWSHPDFSMSVANGILRLSSASYDPSIYRSVSFSGAIHRYITVRSRAVSGDCSTQEIFYGTGSHSHMDGYTLKYVNTGLNDKNWHTVNYDMWNLTRGGDDWKNSDITSIRLDLACNPTAIIDVDFIVVSPTI